MKKRAFLAVLLVGILVFSLFATLTVFAETRPAKGTVADLSTAKNGYYYTNKDFAYSKQSEATSIKYWFYSVSKFLDTVKLHGDVRDYVLNVDASAAVTVSSDKLEITANREGYYVVLDYYATPAEDQENHSEISVVCVDLTAPVVNIAKFTQWLLDPENKTGFDNDFILGARDWEVPLSWAYDIGIVTEANAVTKTSEKDDEGNTTTKTENSKDLLNVYIEYLTPNDYHDGEWENTEGETTLTLTTVGDWFFRFVVKDLAGNAAVDADGNEYIYQARHNVRDLTPPTIKYSTTQLKVQTIGTAAGKVYSIPKPTYSDEISSTTLSYEVFKKVNNVWTVIYDSQTDTVTEGFEDFVAKDKITPSANEATSSVGELYKIVHTVVDSMGNRASAELNIYVSEPEVDAYNVWKIILIAIAVLSAAGIVVLIFVKPREPQYAGNVAEGHDEQPTRSQKADKVEQNDDKKK